MAAGDSLEMQRMQEEALARAREMYERAQNAEYNQKPPEEEPPPAPKRQRRKKTEEGPVIPPRTPHPESQLHPEPPPVMSGNPLDFLMEDKERTLILLLLVMLSEEGNNELMFAMMYLLM